MSTPVTVLQSRIAALLGQSVGDENLDTNSLLADINQVYRFDIPDLIRSGRFTAKIAVVVTVGSGRIDINNISPGVVIYGAILTSAAYWSYLTGAPGSTPLRVYNDYGELWRDYNPVSTETARPTAILIDGTTFLLQLSPDANGYVILNTLLYRSALGISDSITADFESQAIVYLSAAYAASRMGDDDTATRMEKLAGPIFDKLKGLESGSARGHISVGGRF